MSWVDARIKTHFEQWCAPMFKEQCDPLHDGIGEVISNDRAHVLSDVIATERAERQKEVRVAIEESQRAFETKLEALEQRIALHADQRIGRHIDQCAERVHSFHDAIATERSGRQKAVERPTARSMRSW